MFCTRVRELVACRKHDRRLWLCSFLDDRLGASTNWIPDDVPVALAVQWTVDFSFHVVDQARCVGVSDLAESFLHAHIRKARAAKRAGWTS